MIEEPPTTDPIVTQESAGVVSLSWIVFFDSIFRGDAGEAWTPIIENLGVAGGTPKIVGRVYKLSQYLSVFIVTVTPAQGGSTSSVAGSTAINNFPLKAQGNGFCVAVSGNLGSNAGMVDQASNKIYPPVWTGVTVPLTVIGLVEAS